MNCDHEPIYSPMGDICAKYLLKKNVNLISNIANSIFEDIGLRFKINLEEAQFSSESEVNGNSSENRKC